MSTPLVARGNRDERTPRSRARYSIYRRPMTSQPAMSAAARGRGSRAGAFVAAVATAVVALRPLPRRPALAPATRDGPLDCRAAPGARAAGRALTCRDALACYHWYLLLLIPLLVIVDRLHSQRPWRPPLLVVPLAAGVDANGSYACSAGRASSEQGLWRLLSFLLFWPNVSGPVLPRHVADPMVGGPRPWPDGCL